MALPLKISEIKNSFPELFTEQLGQDSEIHRIYSVDDAQKGDLVFVSSKKFASRALKSPVSGVVTTKELAEQFSNQDHLGILISNNVNLAHAALKQEFGDRKFIDDQWGERHPSAVIHPTAKIGSGVIIAPHVTIGENVSIGERTRIQAGVVIEEGAQVGQDCILHANAVVGYNCILKDCVDIGPGTVIGSEGFGFAQDEKRKSHRLPHTGIVVIENFVRIGANNCIDRATYAETKIGTGTKTDNLCHFAHNVEIGEDCLLTSMFCVAGTSKIGDRVMTSGQAGVIDHMNVCSDTVLLHRAGVTKDVTEPGMYAGLPLQPLKQYMKNTAYVRKLDELNKRVKELEQSLSVMKQGSA